MAADDSNLAEHLFHEHDEQVIREQIDPPHPIFSSVYQVPMSDQVFFAQSKVIKKLAMQGPCIIVGRCSDMILEDSINLFVCAKMNKRVERLQVLHTDGTPEELEAKIREVDKKRKEYYQYYTGNTWGKARHYHLCLDSGKVGIDGCIATVLAYIQSIDKNA